MLHNANGIEHLDWHIIDWNNIDLTNRDEQKCECGIKASLTQTINGELKYLARFIQNSLNNIRLHTPDGTAVSVYLHSGKSIELLIEDSGPGLPADSYGEKIRGLKRFDRSRSRENGGTGLGLSIMSAVIERHHGALTLRQSELGGLAIEVHLPRA